ncbi:MAG: AMP-binding protein, partial [Gammaproteobacteria bacterium]|nr:AMP-binding protein [Gammaproteobacteria bacterium]
SALSSGASVLLRRRFSASNLVSDLKENEVTCMVYVGELCRYLVNQPVTGNEADTPLHTAIGNGLRPDIWDEFKNRYGLKRVTELYAASEGNVSFANIFNKDHTIGMTTAQISLIKYDVLNDEIVKNDDGFCIEVPDGEAGLCIGHINPNAQFEGYTNKEATEKKILRNVFEEGDAWFNTGDLLRTVPVGFSLGYAHYQFVDRVGDTFRWRSENVSTNEVAEILNGFEQIDISNVYGVSVPSTEGRAGMATVVLTNPDDALDLEQFSDYVVANLPHYGRPVFVRVQSEAAVTGTMKLVKTDLREEGYDLSRISDPVYVMKPRTEEYVPLDETFLGEIQAGTAGY